MIRMKLNKSHRSEHKNTTPLNGLNIVWKMDLNNGIKKALNKALKLTNVSLPYCFYFCS